MSVTLCMKNISQRILSYSTFRNKYIFFIVPKSIDFHQGILTYKTAYKYILGLCQEYFLVHSSFLRKQKVYFHNESRLLYAWCFLVLFFTINGYPNAYQSYYSCFSYLTGFVLHMVTAGKGRERDVVTLTFIITGQLRNCCMMPTIC